MRYVFFLGSYPALSQLELERVLKGHALSPTLVQKNATHAIIDIPEPLPDGLIDRLGGTHRIAQVIAEGQKLPPADEFLELLSPLARKFEIGLGSLETAVDLPTYAYALKTAAKAQGSNLRFVLPKSKTTLLNAAQVEFHRLVQPPRAEIIFLTTPDGITITRTIAVQDIRAYTIRDTARPAKRGKVGMLTPKLAQIMINLALGDQFPAGKSPAALRLLDPFCGFGTVLQEGWLMGLTTVGMDKGQDMVFAAEKNMRWMGQHFQLQDDPPPKVFTHNVREPFRERWEGYFDAVATEPYLGIARRAPVRGRNVEGAFLAVFPLYAAAFRAFKPILKEGGRVVFLLPAYRAGDEYHLAPEPLLDAISGLGYRMMQLAPREDMLYARPQAFVGRELTVWEKG